MEVTWDTGLGRGQEWAGLPGREVGILGLPFHHPLHFNCNLCSVALGSHQSLHKPHSSQAHQLGTGTGWGCLLRTPRVWPASPGPGPGPGQQCRF